MFLHTHTEIGSAPVRMLEAMLDAMLVGEFPPVEPSPQELTDWSWDLTEAVPSSLVVFLNPGQRQGPILVGGRPLAAVTFTRFGLMFAWGPLRRGFRAR